MLMKNNFFNIIKRNLFSLIGIFFTILFIIFVFVIIVFPIMRFLVLIYSGFLFFKVINRKIVEYGYEERDEIELLFIRYGLLAIYSSTICFLCVHDIFGFFATVLLFFFNKALKKSLYDSKK